MFFFSSDKITTFKPTSVEHAYFAILNNDLDTALQIFKKIDSPRALWGIALVNIINGYVEKYPTYFEIRNFYEIDLDFLLKNEKIEYIESILGALETLSSINQEIYKYTARVMLVNNLPEIAKKYLDKSKEIFYNDVELHYIYAKYYISNSQYNKANFHIDECLAYLPDYHPARLLKKEIAKHLA